jgi:peroxiredoxin
MKKVLSGVFTIAILAVVLWFYKAYKTVPSLPLYETVLVNEAGESINPSDFKGKYVLVSYFQTWCGSCIQELAGFDALQMKVGKDKLKVMVISDEEMKKVLRFKEKYCNTLDYYHSVQTLNDMNIRIFPTTYLLDKSGNVILSKINYFDWDSEEVVGLIK